MGHGDFEQSVGKQWFDPWKPLKRYNASNQNSLTHKQLYENHWSQKTSDFNVLYFLSLGHLMAYILILQGHRGTRRETSPPESLSSWCTVFKLLYEEFHLKFHCWAPRVTLPWCRCLDTWLRRNEWGFVLQHFLTVGSLRIWRASSHFSIAIHGP